MKELIEVKLKGNKTSDLNDVVKEVQEDYHLYQLVSLDESVLLMLVEKK